MIKKILSLYLVMVMKWGINLTFQSQKYPEGIAQALNDWGRVD